MCERCADQHAEYRHRAVAAAFAREDQLAQRASAQQHRAPTRGRHAEETPEIIMVCDWLHGKSRVKIPHDEVAYQHG